MFSKIGRSQALAVGTGATRWSVPASGPDNPSHGPPVVDSGRLFVQDGGLTVFRPP